MTTTALYRPSQVASPGPGTRDRGMNMLASPLLDMIEKLLTAARHPDIVKIEQYGPGQGAWGPDVDQNKVKSITGIKVTHQSSATASIWLAQWPGQEQPIDEPAQLPLPRQNRAPRLAIFVKQLLDVAQPAELKAWRIVKLSKLGNPDTQAHLPSGLSVVAAAGERTLLRVAATGATVGGEPEMDPFPSYTIPEEVKTCLRPAGAASAVR